MDNYAWKNLRLTDKFIEEIINGDEKMTFKLQRVDFNFMESLSKWMFSISERTLLMFAIAAMHMVFVPQMWAYLNNLTETLPSLDSYLVVLFATICMNLRAILKKDQAAQLIHMAGFVGQLVIGMLILLK